MITEALQFYSLRMDVRTDVPEVADYCRRLFGRFLVAPDTPAQQTLELTSLGGKRWRVRDAILDATVDRPDWLSGIVCARVLETVGNEVDDHDLFHGAALSREGRGLVLCGESGFGKSTLTLALLARGWGFLSDEVAAISHLDARLAPFPKSLELVPGSGRRVGVRIEGIPGKRGKIVQDPEELFPGCLAGSCEPRAVVFMDSVEGSADPEKDDALRVSVHHRAPGVIQDLVRTRGVHGALWSGEVDGCPVLEIRRDPRVFPTWGLDELLGRHGLLIVASSAEELAPADFDRPPELEPLRNHAGVARLLSRFRGRRAFVRRLEQHGGNFSDLFLSELERLSALRFYRMVVGRLDEEIELLEQAVRA